MGARLHTIAARLRGFLRRRDLEADFEREIAAHLELAEEDGLRRGLSAEEARRAARVALGGVTQLRESWRAASGLPWIECFALDAKLGLRMLRRSWGLTLAGGLALTIVITLAAVVFVFLDEFMGRTAPPLDAGDRVVALQSWDVEAHRRLELPRSDLARWAATLRSVEDVGGFQTVERRLEVDGRPPEWVRVAEITATGFRLARVQPLLGRWIAEADERAGAAPVVVLGHEAWRSRFGADRGVLGRAVRLGGIFHTVVGVMPEGFAFPVNHGYWVPLPPSPAGALAAAPEGAAFARLAPGVSLARAQAELSAVGLLPRATEAARADPRRPRVVPYTFAFTDDVERGELAWRQRLLLFLVTLLLVPPCLNVAILVYARTVTRQEEFAARYALGASRARIVVQLGVELLVLSAAAGATALALARPILGQIGEVLRRLPAFGGALPFWVDFRLSWRAALFVAGLAVLAALIAGLVPALQATGRVLPVALRSLGHRTGVPLGATWTVLIVAQVALALALLPSTVELAWGHLRPAVLGPGFAAREFLTAELALDPEQPPAGATDAPAFAARVRGLRTAAARQLETELGPVAFTAALPGVEPLVLVEAEDRGGGAPVRRWARANQVDRRFFEVFALPAASGRTLDGRDFATAATVVVDQTFARLVFADAGALGRRIRPVPAAGEDPGAWLEIVGVVADRPANTSQGRMYLPLTPGAPAPAAPLRMVLHARAEAFATARRLQAAGAGLDPALRLDAVRRLDEVLAEAQTSSSLTSYALAVVTLSVLVLSAAGLYALMAFTVTLRRREIGIRTALGARRGRLLAGVFARALRQVAVGLAVGIGVAAGLHRWLAIEVEGGWHIPGILPAAAAFLVVLGLLAAAGPARRAVGVDPTEALRDG